MTSLAAERADMAEGDVAYAVIDTDVHPTIDLTAQSFREYLPERWREYLDMRGIPLGRDFENTLQRQFAHRLDSMPPGGGPPASDPEFARKQLLDENNISAAILNNVTVAAGGSVPVDHTLALVRASNEFIHDHWLASDPRWYSSITVWPEQAVAAAEEVRRCVERSDRFRQVLFSSRNEMPIGNPRYRPVLEAAAELGIPIGFHLGLCKASQFTASGTPNYYFEKHVGGAQQSYTQIASLIFEGVFDRFPGLRVALLELNWAWAVPFGHRLDACWRVMRTEVPHLQQKPSDYLRERFWFSTQPAEEPTNPRWLGEVFEQIEDFGLAGHLMYSSDYPHWDFDAPGEGIPHGISDERRRHIFSGSASDLYGIAV
jgi:predicted TIM-barrel fold metal-dependent hydrolase